MVPVSERSKSGEGCGSASESHGLLKWRRASGGTYTLALVDDVMLSKSILTGRSCLIESYITSIVRSRFVPPSHCDLRREYLSVGGWTLEFASPLAYSTQCRDSRRYPGSQHLIVSSPCYQLTLVAYIRPPVSTLTLHLTELR